MFGPPTTYPNNPPTTAPGGPATMAPAPAPIPTPSNRPASATTGATDSNTAIVPIFNAVRMMQLLRSEGLIRQRTARRIDPQPATSTNLGPRRPSPALTATSVMSP